MDRVQVSELQRGVATMIETVSRRLGRHRLLDTASKLLGLALLSGALEVGIASAPGAVLAIAGIAAGVSTVFVSEDST
jgi:hypothetical protein